MNVPRNLLLLLGLCAVAACERQDAISTAGNASEVVFNRGNGGEPATLDPHRNEDDGGANILRDLYEGLTTENVAAEVVPGAAESWEISLDGLVYSYVNRHLVKPYMRGFEANIMNRNYSRYYRIERN